ncbi:MAG TPA: SCO family protein [Candidatus Binataceae bacterium]|nr:SCO family protein [Candidatus Binataceae bacterium]
MTLNSSWRSISVGPFVLAAAIAAAGCHRRAEQTIGAECLSNVKLVDTQGKPFELSSLKGKPVVVDFIYTSCPGPCLMETAKLANVALRLGPDLGSKVAMVSLTVDPEHDGASQMRDYVEKQGADFKGWYFLTGSPPDVDDALAGFKLARQREPDGSVAHLVTMVLVGPDGREIQEYNGESVKAQTIVEDVKKVLSGEKVS